LIWIIIFIWNIFKVLCIFQSRKIWWISLSKLKFVFKFSWILNILLLLGINLCLHIIFQGSASHPVDQRIFYLYNFAHVLPQNWIINFLRINNLFILWKICGHSSYSSLLANIADTILNFLSSIRCSFKVSWWSNAVLVAFLLFVNCRYHLKLIFVNNFFLFFRFFISLYISRRV
jgi:hypothetical protein